MGEGLEDCMEGFFFVTFYTILRWGQADLLYINLHTRSIRVIVLYFIFLVRKNSN